MSNIRNVARYKTPLKVSQRILRTAIMRGLSPSQRVAVQLVERGDNVFVTGSPGTGKTKVIKELVRLIVSVYGLRFGITSTASAAANLVDGSKTLHRFMRMGLGEDNIDVLWQKLSKSSYALKDLASYDVLVIDEISMIEIEFLEKINEIFKRIFNNRDQAFGGLQVIFVGDMSQLSSNDSAVSYSPEIMLRPSGGEKVFMSNAWRELNLRVCLLKENWRARRDPKFFEFVEAVRYGEVTDEMWQYVCESRSDMFRPGMTLVCRKPEVEEYNRKAYMKALTDRKAYPARGYSTMWCKDLPIEQTLFLYKGMPVVLVSTHLIPKHNLPNGTFGEIVELKFQTVMVRFATKKGDVTVEVEYQKWTVYDEQRNEHEVWQLPIIGALAITIHRVQGLTIGEEVVIDETNGDFYEIHINIDLTRQFSPSQAYVALTRLTERRLLTFKGERYHFDLDSMTIEYNRLVREMDEENPPPEATEEIDF
jgi:hypothetical protein